MLPRQSDRVSAAGVRPGGVDHQDTSAEGDLPLLPGWKRARTRAPPSSCASEARRDTQRRVLSLCGVPSEADPREGGHRHVCVREGDFHGVHQVEVGFEPDLRRQTGEKRAAPSWVLCGRGGAAAVRCDHAPREILRGRRAASSCCSRARARSRNGAESRWLVKVSAPRHAHAALSAVRWWVRAHPSVERASAAAETDWQKAAHHARRRHCSAVAEVPALEASELRRRRARGQMGVRGRRRRSRGQLQQQQQHTRAALRLC